LPPPVPQSHYECTFLCADFQKIRFSCVALSKCWKVQTCQNHKIAIFSPVFHSRWVLHDDYCYYNTWVASCNGLGALSASLSNFTRHPKCQKSNRKAGLENSGKGVASSSAVQPTQRNNHSTMEQEPFYSPY
jgi:hypothetical protein